MPQHSEQMKRSRQEVKMGLAPQFQEAGLHPKKGTFILDMRDARTGEVLAFFEKDENNQQVEGQHD